MAACKNGESADSMISRIYNGDIHDLPKHESNEIRVFFSSTFTGESSTIVYRVIRDSTTASVPSV